MESTSKTYPRLGDILLKVSEIDYKNLTNERKKELLNQFEEFYKVNERHQYSDVSNFLYKNKLENLEYLMSNLIEIYEYSNDSEFKKKIFKIIDHVKLESLRSTYMTAEIKEESVRVFSSSIEQNNITFRDFKRKIDSQINIINQDTKKAQDYIEEIEVKMIESEDKIKKLNVESITILSIFSGIVIAFFGGLGFFNEVLKNMHKVSKYRLTFITLIIGFVLFNTLFLLMYSIGKIVDKPIRNKCLSKDCSCDTECCSINKVKNLYPILYYMNLIFIIMIIAVIVVWYIYK